MVRIEQSSTQSTIKAARHEYVCFERFISMKRSLKALLAIAASSATTLALATPSNAVIVPGGDEQKFTGVYSAELETTRSCTITSVGNNNQGGALDAYGGGGTVIGLKRKPNTDKAIGNIKISFEATGVNAVYFEDDFTVGRITVENGQATQVDEDGKGEMTVRLDQRQEDTGDLSGRVKGDIQDQLNALGNIDLEADTKIVATVSSDNGKTGGLILGGQKKGDDEPIGKAKSLAAVNDIYSRPTEMEAVLSMEIDNITEAGSSAIQATLVCAPLAIDYDSGTIAPIVGN